MTKYKIIDVLDAHTKGDSDSVGADFIGDTINVIYDLQLDSMMFGEIVGTDTTLRTSRIKGLFKNDDGHLEVTTRNTIYVLEEI